jgi:circadian clock protein KaiC
MDNDGISVMPITSAGLSHGAPTERISSGVAGLDEMLGQKGFFRGSSILITGTAGTGKSSFGASFAHAACNRGERALYFSFEESPSQILRNMSSVGLDLNRCLSSGLLKIHSSRPTNTGLEAHLAQMYNEVQDFLPDVVVVDPVTNLIAVGDHSSVKGMLTRVIDFLKTKNITALFTNLVYGDEEEERAIGISSLMDGWLVLRDMPNGTERIRTLNLLKCRGMAHDMRMHTFTLGEKGITINGNYQTIGAIQAH